jgi:hypothetical protein
MAARVSRYRSFTASERGCLQSGDGKVSGIPAGAPLLSDLEFAKVLRLIVRQDQSGGPESLSRNSASTSGTTRFSLTLLPNKGEFNDTQTARGSAGTYKEHLSHGPQ